MKKQKSIANNIVLNVIKTFSAAFFPVVTYMYVARIFGVDGYGQISFSKTYVNYYLLFAMLGVENYGAREAAKVRDDRDELSKTVFEIMVINIISMTAAYLLLFISVITIGKLSSYKMLIMLFSLELLFQVFSIEWFYLAIEDFKYITTRTVLFQAASLVATLLFVHNYSDMPAYVIIQVSAIGLTGVLNLLHTMKYISVPRRVPLISIFSRVKPIFFFFLITASVSVFRQLDTIMLGFMGNDTDVGLYAAGDKMSAIISRVVSAISAVMLPRLSYYSEQGNTTEIKRMTNRAAKLILMVAVPIAMGVLVLGKEIVYIFSGSGFLQAVNTTRILSARILLSPINTLYTINLFVPLGWEKKSLITLNVAAILDFFINICVIPIFAYNGAAMATVLAEIIELLIILYIGKEYISVCDTFKNGLRYLFASLVIPLVYFLVHFLRFGYMMITFATFMISAFLYFCILLYLRDGIFLECLARARKMTQHFIKRSV